MLAGGPSFSLVTEGEEWSGRVLKEKLGDKADELSAGGAVKGSVVPLVVSSTAECVIEILALWRIQAVPVLLSPLLPASELARARRAVEGMSSELRDETAPSGTSSMPGKPRNEMPHSGASGMSSEPGNEKARAGTTEPTSTVALIRTSGTAGSPRFVALGAENVRASVLGSVERLGLGASDTWLASLSMAHVGGLMILARAWTLGCRLVVPSAEAMPAIGQIERALFEGYGEGPATHLSLVPTQLSRLLELRGGTPPPPTLRCVLVGGARLPEALLSRSLDLGWPVALTYGMTETTSQAATANVEQVRLKPGTVGRPLPGVEIDTSPEGEVRVRGAVLAVEPGTDGWHRTGDFGRIDRDGDLWITGRRSDRIVSGGVTIEAAEVEAVLAGHPAVADVCVLGLADELWGEVVAACVVPIEGEFDLAELGEWSGSRLPPSHRPRRWLMSARLPLNATGKVDRISLRRRFGRS